MYCTPTRFRNSGLGIDFTGISDVDLKANLVRAATRVDAYCNVPMLPQRFTFKGGTMIGEKHGWTDSFARRVYLSAFPVRSVEALRIDATNNLYVDFAPSDLYVNYAEGYVEIINFAITKAGIWGEANVPQLGLSQPVSIVDYTYGSLYEVDDEDTVALPTVSGGPTSFMAENGYWDPVAAVEVKKNNSIVSTGITIDRDTGMVVFDTPLLDTDAVKVSYSYSLPFEICEANNIITSAFLGERSLIAKGLTGLESLTIEELSVRRIGSRSGAERGIDVPASAANLLDGYRFWTAR